MIFPGAIVQRMQDNPEWIVIEEEASKRKVSAADLLDMVERLATAMRTQGYQRGTTLVLRLDVSAESVAAYLAAYACGCLIVDIRPGLSQEHIDHILQQSDGQSLDCATVADFLETPKQPLQLLAEADDIARIIYTSGSTGMPKGCAMRYGTITEHWSVNADNLDHALRNFANASSRFLVYGTLASIAVKELAVLALSHGATLLFPDPSKAMFPEVVERLQVSASFMNVPRFYQMLTDLEQQDWDMSSLQGLLVSGSPVAAKRLEAATDRLGPIIYNAYGQSESSCIAITRPQDILAGRADAVGRPLSNVDVEIRDGEIYVRNPLAPQEYWQEPVLTAEVFQDGWTRTRDLGYMDGDYLYLTGRARDVILVNALPVYIGPIETQLTQHSSVAEAYVVGIPDDSTGESVHAFIIASRGATIDPEQLRQLVHETLGASSVPQSIHVIDKAPELPSGKVDKDALTDMLLSV